MEPILRVAGLIAGAGLIGGLWQHLRSDASAWSFRSILKHWLGGTIAAALIPVFFEVVDSQLLERFLTPHPVVKDGFVLFGFCLLAAATAEKFIEGLSAKVLAQLEETKKKAEEAEKKADVAEEKAKQAETRSVGVGKRPRPQGGEGGLVKVHLTEGADEVEGADPRKGRFGGKPEADHRRLEAEFLPVSGTDLVRLRLRVLSTDPAKHPLSGQVQLFLHPTFWDPEPVVPVGADGVAELEVTSYGAFTVGAVADGGKTRLELDLAQHPGAPEPFRSR